MRESMRTEVIVMASGIIGFILGLLIGAGIMAAATAAARDDASRAEDKDAELKMLKKNNRALTDYCNALLDENRRLARSIGREKP